MSVLKKTGLLLGLPVVLLTIWWVATEGSTDPYVPPTTPSFPPTSSGTQGGTTTGGYGGTA